MAVNTRPLSTQSPLRWQPTLLGAAPVAIGGKIARTSLDASSWVDHCPEWLQGSDDLFAELASGLSWQTGRRPMYDRIVAVPRLSAFPNLDSRSLPPIIAEMAAWLSNRYGRQFERVGCNLYRNGNDSVAWHADRIGRTEHNPLVALVSLGERRPFRLRPSCGEGSTASFALGGGDLLVMGGACQHRWEHAVPKVAAAGPRISLGFRHGADPEDLAWVSGTRRWG